jgi:hypothetical protein
MGYGTLDVPSNVKGMKSLSALHVGAKRPRSTEDTHPDRILTVWNVETLMGSGVAPMAQTSRPFRKEGTILQEDRTVQEANAGSRKAQGRHDLPDRATTTWRYPARKGADVDRVSDPKSTVTVTNRRKS